MSYCAIEWARSQVTGSPTLKSVLIAVAIRADKDGTCWPSQAAIAADLEMGERTVRRALAELEAKSFLIRQRRDVDGYRATDLLRLPDNYRPHRPVELPATQAELPAGAAGPTGHTGQSYRPERPGESTEKEETLTHSAHARTREQGTMVPEGWKPEPRERAWAEQQLALDPHASHTNVDTEAQRFVDHHRAGGILVVDTKAAFRKWVREGARFRPRQQQAPSRNGASNVDANGRPVSFDREGRRTAFAETIARRIAANPLLNRNR